MECSAPNIFESQFELEHIENRANKTYVVCLVQLLPSDVLSEIVPRTSTKSLSDFFNIASPATSKLGMRMTTLHEEPLGGHRSLDEEPEDSYSDSEYAAEYEQERQQNRGMGTRSRLTASKTMDSFMDVSSHSNPSYLSYTSSANANMKHLTGLATLSMSSSTSSGYGSQAVSCNNLSNEDITSMRSMSIDETPGTHKQSLYEICVKYWFLLLQILTASTPIRHQIARHVSTPSLRTCQKPKRTTQQKLRNCKRR